ncbi:MAG: Stp1/IreP family PP2C-type Ser/Thr phosphatase [Lachnospiraceae bacterium]
MKTFSITDVGQLRGSNQDSCHVSDSSIGNLPNLFLVADGMGGHQAGEFAANYTVTCIVDTVKDSQEHDPESILIEAINAANRNLIENASMDESRHGMGTTVVAASVTNGHLTVANVGDSRLYIVNQSIRQVTRDHSLVEEMVRLGEMNREEAKRHPDRNIITRAVGASNEIRIDIFHEEVCMGDFILMCSDGLTNMIEDETILSIFMSQPNITKIAEKLVETANSNGGADNITVVLVEPFSDEVKE